jgi:phosphate transport system substrate-binding protein
MKSKSNFKFINCFLFSIVYFVFSCTNVKIKKESKLKTFRIVGSETVLPIIEKEANEFSKTNSTYKLFISGGGSKVGIQSLLKGNTEIAMTSRYLSNEEQEIFKKLNKKIIIKKIAYDALSVIVNKNNKIQNLTKQNLKDIFTGKITNWKHFGGKDCEIIICSREKTSGSFEYFKQKTLDNEEYSSKMLKTKISQAIIQLVGMKEGAIGYVGIAQLRPTIQPVSISFDETNRFLYPSIEKIATNEYPLKRPLFLVYELKNSHKLSKFLKFIESNEGQDIISLVGGGNLKN